MHLKCVTLPRRLQVRVFVFTNKNNDLQRGKDILPGLHSYQIEELQPEPTDPNSLQCDSFLTIGMYTDCGGTPSKLDK